MWLDLFLFLGKEGPQVMMTDMAASEHSAIAEVFPGCKQLLCIFHVLQAAWRWLWSTGAGIAKGDRPSSMGFIRKLLYSHTEEELEKR